MSIEIRKAGIRSGIFLSYEYNMEEAGISAKNKTQSTAPIHEDLENAFIKLIPHFILLTEEMPIEKLEDVIENGGELSEDIKRKYSVTEFTFGGSEDSKSVVLTGYKILSNDKSVSFSTPTQKLFEDKKDGYKFNSELNDAIEALVQEVHEYMDGKAAPRNEVGSFDFDAEDDAPFNLPSDEQFAENLSKSLSEGFDGVDVTFTANGKSKTIKGNKNISALAIEAGTED